MKRRVLGMAGVLAVVVLIASACVLSGSWTALTPAAPPAPPPGVTSDPDFADVSCPTEDFCLAVGASVDYQAWNWAPLAQVWDGSTWAVVDTADLVEPDTAELDLGIRLHEVSCRSTTDCVAVSEEFVDFDGGADTYYDVFHWDGTDWTPLLDDPDQMFHETRKDVDCAVGGICLAWVVGEPESYFWDGTTWARTDESLQANAAGSCFGPTFCVRIAAYSGQSFVEHWDGSDWTEVPFPIEYFNGAVDCTSATRCLAVGSIDEPGPLRSALWDGTAWTEKPVPVPESGEVSGLSCASSAECVALVVTDTAPVTLAWNGKDWYEIAGPPGQPGTLYEGLSCVGLSCVAVGWSGPPATSGLAAAEYTWTRD